MNDLLSLPTEQFFTALKQHGFPDYRAKQINKWLLSGCRDFSAMSNLPSSMREYLSSHYSLYRPTVLRHQRSDIDGTEKYLWKLCDGHSVETVLMQYHYGNTVCISSQVGCRQGCSFCASTIGGLVRSLSCGEMLDEVLFTEEESQKKVSNIVMMGIGEPLDNLDEVLRFLRMVSDKNGRNIGLRHITISTCGLLEGIKMLAREKLPITLSLSLHAPDDETRSRIMPSNCGVEKVLNACREYQNLTGRRISFEYAMIDGVNDSVLQAELLARHANRIGAHVNLIPLNHVDERKLNPSSSQTIKQFQSILERHGVNVTVRRRLGSDIDASCGQLRRKYNREN